MGHLVAEQRGLSAGRWWEDDVCMIALFKVHHTPSALGMSTQNCLGPDSFSSSPARIFKICLKITRILLAGDTFSTNP
jgi:hypothetical protein